MLEVVPFNYDEIKTDITDRLIAKGYNASENGTNAAMLASVLAYTLSMLNVNTAFNTSEMLLSSATKDTNILNIARQMGYEAQNKVSFSYRITLKAKLDETRDPMSSYTNLYEIPKYSKFTSGSYNYYYMGDTIRRYVSNKNITEDNSNSYFTIIVKEGDLKLASDYPDTLVITTTTILVDNEIQTQNYIDIPLTNVEDDGIELYLTYIDAYGVEHIDELWTKSTQFLIDKDTNLTRQFMRLEDLTTKTPKCYFQLAGIGNELRLNTIIKANVLISNGSLGAASGNMELGTDLSRYFALYDGVNTDYNQTLVVTGQEVESTDSIKLNAPLFHNSANRAVTKGDYISICNRQSVVDITQVWGGEDELPIILGYIYLSMLPSYKSRVFTNDSLKNNFLLSTQDDTNSFYIKDTEIRSVSYDQYGELTEPGVFDILDEFKIMTMKLNHRQPIFMNFDFNINIVTYSLKNTKEEIHQATFDLINEYFKTYIEQYESQYFHSNLIKRVDSELTDLTGVNMTVKNSISLYDKNIVSERVNADEQQIIFFLSVPYNDYTNSDGELIPGILPEIYTENFITTGDVLEVDWNNPTPSIELNTADYFWFNIKYNGVICGRYYVTNKIKKNIRIDLYVNGGSAVDLKYANSPLINSMFNGHKKINVSYKTPNFKVFRNTIPRLTSVTFE